MSDIFDGLKVVDLTMGWAGPLTTMLLADHGADVLKIEGPAHPDWWRKGSAALPAGDFSDAGQRNWERSSLFNSVNRNKRGLVVDLTDERGRQLVRQLIQQADIAIDSFSPGVTQKLGLDYVGLRNDNPRLITMSLPAVGTVGPWSHYVGYASTTEALAGLPSVCGYPNQPILQSLRVADPLGGLNGAAALSIALLARELSGVGQHVEVPQLEGMVAVLGEAMMEFALNRRVRPRSPQGHVATRYAPYGCFPSAGQDRWVVVCVRTDAQWISLCAVLRRPDLRDDPRLASSEGRVAHRDDVDQAVAAWTARHSPATAARQLQESGVPAGPVNTAADLLDDPATAPAFVRSEHPVVGEHPYPRVTCQMSRTPGSIRRPAPLFGQHNREILQEHLGLSDPDVEALEHAGVLATEPRAANRPAQETP